MSSSISGSFCTIYPGLFSPYKSRVHASQTYTLTDTLNLFCCWMLRQSFYWRNFLCSSRTCFWIFCLMSFLNSCGKISLRSCFQNPLYSCRKSFPYSCWRIFRCSCLKKLS